MKTLCKYILNWLKNRRNGIVIFVFWAIIIYCMLKQHIYIAFILMFIMSLIEIRPIKDILIKFIKSTFALKLYNLIIWFSSYVLSLKLLSYFTGINEEKLKFAPAIMAIPISVIMMYVLVLLFSFLMIFAMQIMTPFSIFMTTRFKNNILKSRAYDFANRFNHLIILLAPVLLVAVYLSPPFMRLALLADSSFVSDCGSKEKNKSYIRIDKKTCLKFELNFSTLSTDPVVISKIKQD